MENGIVHLHKKFAQAEYTFMHSSAKYTKQMHTVALPGLTPLPGQYEFSKRLKHPIDNPFGKLDS